ncbi:MULTISPECIES: cortex morphogenetic protein CmpA [Bacillaceae]|nr:cortex morphogenetic protein CmpA [Bacillus sp. FJAT-27916]
MPLWLQNQIQRAFYEKDSKQILLLNQCWYFYKKSIASES